jgi:hypothetical protein
VRRLGGGGRDLGLVASGWVGGEGARGVGSVFCWRVEQLAGQPESVWCMRQLNNPNHANLKQTGKYWCWVHWSFETATYEFTKCKEVLLRAWDSRLVWLVVAGDVYVFSQPGMPALRLLFHQSFTLGPFSPPKFQPKRPARHDDLERDGDDEQLLLPDQGAPPGRRQGENFTARGFRP